MVFTVEHRIKDALSILDAIGIPIERMTVRRRKRVVMALRALANLTVKDDWSRAQIWGQGQTFALTTRQIIKFWNLHFGENLSSGSYDDVRREDCRTEPDAGARGPARYVVRNRNGQAVLSRDMSERELEQAERDHWERLAKQRDRREKLKARKQRKAEGCPEVATT